MRDRRVLQDDQDHQWVERADPQLCQCLCSEDACGLTTQHVVETQAVHQQAHVVDLLFVVLVRGRKMMRDAAPGSQPRVRTRPFLIKHRGLPVLSDFPVILGVEAHGVRVIRLSPSADRPDVTNGFKAIIEAWGGILHVVLEAGWVNELEGEMFDEFAVPSSDWEIRHPAQDAHLVWVSA